MDLEETLQALKELFELIPVQDHLMEVIREPGSSDRGRQQKHPFPRHLFTLFRFTAAAVQDDYNSTAGRVFVGRDDDRDRKV
jgi:hypothetical protein